MLAARSSSATGAAFAALARFGLLVGLLVSLLAGCPAPPAKPTSTVGSFTLEIGRDGGSLRGVAGDGDLMFAAIAGSSSSEGSQSTIEARRGQTVVWTTPIAGTVGPLAFAPGLLATALGGTGRVADLPLRGGPGAVVAALDPATGQIRWKLPIDSSEWSVITAIATVPDQPGGVVVGGQFSGTLRAGTHTVSSAGKIDGFVARLTHTGAVAWLVRMGGRHADAVQGVAAAGGRVAITGTFATTAELGGEELTATDDKAPTVDVFVAELDDTSGRRTWSASFGGRLDDSVAGVAIDARGRVAVAATVRGTLRVDVADISVRGPTDGLLVWYEPDGSPGPSILIGGDGADELRAIAAIGDRVVVGGVFTAPIQIGRDSYEPDGSTDAFLAIADGASITRSIPVRGTGREEITALAAIPGGFLAGIAHTAAASIGGEPVPSPADPASGFALAARPR